MSSGLGSNRGVDGTATEEWKVWKAGVGRGRGTDGLEDGRTDRGGRRDGTDKTERNRMNGTERTRRNGTDKPEQIENEIAS